MQNRVLLIIIAVLFISVGLSCAETRGESIARVCIGEGKDTVSLFVKGSYKIYAVDSDKALMQGSYLSAAVTADKDSMKVGNKNFKVNAVTIKVAGGSDVYVDNRKFRGDVDIVTDASHKLLIINHVALEEYLYGVLYNEVSHRWPMEALKAQAIAARTFALYQIRQNSGKPYDLRNDIYSQVYGGKASEKWSTTKAVDVTKGKVLVYKGDIFPAYYHATCAGGTEDATNLWKIDIPPLDGVICNYCAESPHYKWSEEIPLWTFAGKLKDAGYKIDDISSVDVLSKNKSGRVEKIEIKDKTGASIILTGKDFRQILGPNDVRGAKFDVSVKWENLSINGFGWGHGAGMCQWGAFGMSSKGKKAEEILKYYYPGAEITTIDKLPGKSPS